jgi:antitoxin MazE
MRSRVQKWGNSLAVRLPKSFAIEAGIDEDSSVDISFENGKIVVAAAAVDVPSLEELVAKITRSNRHGEWDTGRAVGKETW